MIENKFAISFNTLQPFNFLFFDKFFTFVLIFYLILLQGINYYFNKKMKKDNNLISISKVKIELTKQQRLFNSRIEKIDILEKKLKLTQELVHFAHTELARVMPPIEAEDARLEEGLVLLLDSRYNDKGFTKKEKEKMAFIIENTVLHLIETQSREDLIPLHNRYATETYGEKQEKDMRNSMDFFKNMFGLDLDKDDLDFSSEENTARFYEKMSNQLDEKIQQKQEELAKETTQRRKTKKQIEKEEIEKFEKASIRKISRTIYLNLVKHLHPDKEQDEAQKAWKTAMMAQVTTAYEGNNFFELLKLQSQFLHTEQDHYAQLKEEDLVYYNQILQEQIKEIERQIEVIKMRDPFSDGANNVTEYINQAPNIQKVAQRIKKEAKERIRINEEKAEELEMFTKDNKTLKYFLKNFQMPSNNPLDMIDDNLLAMLQNIAFKDKR